ncbi:unnamed protein product [Ixodes persulcatus]
MFVCFVFFVYIEKAKKCYICPVVVIPLVGFTEIRVLCNHLLICYGLGFKMLVLRTYFRGSLHCNRNEEIKHHIHELLENFSRLQSRKNCHVHLLPSMLDHNGSFNGFCVIAVT